MSNVRMFVHVIILLALLLAPLPWAKTAVEARLVDQAAPQGQGLEALPLDAQGAVSAVLGRDNRAYHFDQLQTGMYQVANPDQQLSAYFEASAAQVEAEGVRWDMRLQGWGYGSNLAATGEPVLVQADANRVEYRHSGLVEWYVNGPLGLQQGFTLAQPPAARSNGSPLTLALGLDGLSAQVEAGGKGAMLLGPDSETLRYGGLIAYDASGQSLPAWLEVGESSKQLYLRVQDSGAIYPIIIDPFVSKMITHSDALNDHFGFSVALNTAGDVAAIGAYDVDVNGVVGQGAVYIFKSGNGEWRQTARLVAPDGAAGDRFGISVSLSSTGNTALIGADKADVGGNVDQGAAYVFRPDILFGDGPWSQDAKLVASDGAAGDRLGWSVAIDLGGSTAIAGAHTADVSGQVDQGAAYVFIHTVSGWYPQDKLVNGVAGDYLGYSVALSDNGDNAIVGAPGNDEGAVSNIGAARLFSRSGGIWSAGISLLPTGGAADDWFGRSVAFDADASVALVGASLADVGAHANQGEAYVFSRVGASWSQQAVLVDPNGVGGNEFGVSVALNDAGDVALVGAYLDDSYSRVDQGAALVCRNSGGSWTCPSKMTPGANGDRFGVSVALNAAGDLLLAGAYYTDMFGNVEQGAAYVWEYTGEAYGWEQQAKLTSSGAPNNGFGASISMSDDGDTAVVGTIYLSVNDNIYQGAAYIFSRSGFSWTQQARLTASDGAANDRFGVSVAISGDGSTILVGATGASSSVGAAYVFVLSGSTWTQQDRLNAVGGVSTDYFGTAAALSDNGNVALVGANGVGIDRGAAYIFTRSGTTWTQAAKLQASDGADHDCFGGRVALDAAGNTALVGVPWAEVDDVHDAGAAYVFARSGASWPQQAKLVASEIQDDASLGDSVALSDDGNTVLAGAPFAHIVSADHDHKGAAYVFVRSGGSTWSQQAKLVNSAASGRYGDSVALSDNGNVAVISCFWDIADSPYGAIERRVLWGGIWISSGVIHFPVAYAANDEFGAALAADSWGRHGLVTAPLTDAYGNTDQGAMYAFFMGYDVYLPMLMK